MNQEELSKDQPLTYSGPFLIGIGAAKSGTTWLFDNLRTHPQIQTTPLKELHYFDQLHGHNQFPARFIDAERTLTRLECSPANEQDPDVIRWYKQYLAPVALSDEWYLSLFGDFGGRIPLDISPGYAVMSASGFAHMATTLPHAHVVFMMRDPVERSWSQFRRDVFERTTKPMTIEHINRILDGPVFSDRSNYVETIRMLEDAYSRRQITYAFYEEVFANPLGTLSSICSSLGIGFSPERFPNLAMRSNPSPQLNMPSDVRRHLRDRYARQYEFVIERFGRTPDLWLSNLAGGQ